MKGLHWNKKSYKGITLEKIFNGILSIVLVIETNLISQTLEISDICLVLIGALIVALLVISMIIKVNRMKAEIRGGNRVVISDNAIIALEWVSKYGSMPIIPLLLLIIARENNQRFFLIILSILLLLLVKSCFDNIITYTDRGYSSGFDEIKLESSCRVELKQTKKFFGTCEIIYVELYKGDVFWGWDKLVQADAIYILNMLRKADYSYE